MGSNRWTHYNNSSNKKFEKEKIILIKEIIIKIIWIWKKICKKKDENFDQLQNLNRNQNIPENIYNNRQYQNFMMMNNNNNNYNINQNGNNNNLTPQRQKQMTTPY